MEGPNGLRPLYTPRCQNHGIFTVIAFRAAEDRAAPSPCFRLSLHMATPRLTVACSRPGECSANKFTQSD